MWTRSEAVDIVIVGILFIVFSQSVGTEEKCLLCQEFLFMIALSIDIHSRITRKEAALPRGKMAATPQHTVDVCCGMENERKLIQTT